ncbi:putative kinesin light chain [Ilyonectria robusta]
MNKFPGPKDANFQQVKEAIKNLADDASSTVKNRQKSSHTRHFIVPFGRNHDFVGRESILHDIVNRVPPDLDNDDCQRTAIEGLGGVGKTQVALEAIYQVHEAHDCSIFWVPTINTTSFENAYREIGRQLGVPGLDNDQADVKTLVKLALSDETAGPWLLVIDNADDKELLFGDEGLCEYLPFSRKGSILFTTRNHEVTTHLCIPMTNIFKMAEMNGIEATQLLHNNLRESQTRDLKSPESLLACLAHLPLAIKQASSYMAKTGMSTAKYLDYFQSGDKTRSQLLSRDFEDSNRYKTTRNPIATTWIISFDHILRDAPLAAEYLKFICFLAEKNIPVSLLPRGEDDLAAEEAIGTLKGYAFITEREDSSSFDIHRLVRLAMRNWLEEEGEWTQCFTIVIQQLARVYPTSQHENKEVWTEYLPHAQASLEGRGECKDENALHRLLVRVGNCYGYLGKLQVSMEIQQQTLELSTRVFGPEHPNTLGSMHNLAITLGKHGKYVAAKSMLRQTLEIRKRILGPEHPDTLVSMNGLAFALSSQRKYVAAERILQQTLDLQRVVLGPEHPDTLKSMHGLAVSLGLQGKYNTAEQIFQQTLDLQRVVLGPEHPDTLESMHGLAVSLEMQGKHNTAERIFQQTLDLQRVVLGPEHPDTLKSMHGLAVSLEMQGKHNTAEQIFQQTLDLRRVVLGPEHPDTVESMQNLAVSLEMQGKHNTAEQIFQQTLDLRRVVLGPEHPDTVESMQNLAVSLESQGKHDTADKVCRGEPDLTERILADEHPNTPTPSL